MPTQMWFGNNEDSDGIVFGLTLIFYKITFIAN